MAPLNNHKIAILGGKSTLSHQAAPDLKDLLVIDTETLECHKVLQLQKNGFSSVSNSCVTNQTQAGMIALAESSSNHDEMRLLSYSAKTNQILSFSI